MYNVRCAMCNCVCGELALTEGKCTQFVHCFDSMAETEREKRMKLSELAANAALKQELSEIMQKHTLPHAVMIDGAAGTGKRTLANILAGYCVCTAAEQKPCGQCSGCMKAQKQIHPDIIIADGEETGALSIDAVRRMRSSAYIVANEAPMKVFLLLNCDKMQIPAQNALLKILEEPPENVQFIMTVRSASAMLPTIRSRVRVFSLFPAGVQEAVQVVQKRLADKTEEEILHAAEVCDGNIGRMLQMLESGGEQASLLAEQMLTAIMQSAEYPLLTLAGQLNSRNLAVSVLDCLTELAAESVRASVGLAVSSAAAAAMAERYSLKRIMKLAETIQDARNLLNTNVNLNLFGTWLCAVLRTQ